MITIHEMDQGSPEWLELRHGKYTGSNADKLLRFGKIPYSQNSDDSSNGRSFWTERGHTLEPEAIEIYNRIFERKYGVKNAAFLAGFVTNDRFPDCGYSPDAMTSQVLLEVKCFDEKGHKELLSGEIPFKILAQIYFGLLITERRLAHLIAYNPKFEDPKDAFRIIPIPSKKAVAANLRRILK